MTMAAKSRFLEIAALDRLSHMRFAVSHAVEGSYAGRHRSRHKGGAAEFLEHRQYSPGDDLRRLDWKVLGRTGRPYVRLYEDETNLVATLVLDVSRSMTFGAASPRDTTGSKLDYASRLAAAIGYIIMRERDRFGLALVSSDLDAFYPPAASAAQLETVVTAIERLDVAPDTYLAPALRTLFARLGRRGLLILMSDFLDEDLEGLFGAIRIFRHQHFNVLLLHILHPGEERLPAGPAYRFEGLEGEGHLDCSPHEIGDLYEQRFNAFLTGLRSRAMAAGCSYHLFSTAVPYVEQLKSLLVERHA